MPLVHHPMLLRGRGQRNNVVFRYGRGRYEHIDLVKRILRECMRKGAEMGSISREVPNLRIR
jgi:hypothetical protein